MTPRWPLTVPGALYYPAIAGRETRRQNTSDTINKRHYGNRVNNELVPFTVLDYLSKCPNTMAAEDKVDAAQDKATTT